MDKNKAGWAGSGCIKSLKIALRRRSIMFGTADGGRSLDHGRASTVVRRILSSHTAYIEILKCADLQSREVFASKYRGRGRGLEVIVLMHAG